MEILYEFHHSRGKVKIVKLDNGEVWRLVGDCCRCGMCCEDLKMEIEEFKTPEGRCNKLSYETVDGKRVATCHILWQRPAACLFYPRDPYDPLYDECSFSWEKLSG